MGSSGKGTALNPNSITVGVATCGRPTSLRRCLQALAEGSSVPGEVIVVDQAPTPEARTWTTQIEGLSIRYVEQERLGLSASRNLALALAAQPVLAVIDDDCAPDAGWVAAIATALDVHPSPAAITGPILPLGPQPPGGYAVSLRESRQAIDHFGKALPWSVGSGANFAAPCDTLRSLGGWDERLGTGSRGKAGEDADLIYRLLRTGGMVRYEPSAVVRHEWHTWDERLATRWSYGYGIGALCGLWLRRGDLFAARMFAAYARVQVRHVASALWHRDRGRIREHGRALVAVAPGLLYGVRARPRTESSTGEAPR